MKKKNEKKRNAATEEEKLLGTTLCGFGDYSPTRASLEREVSLENQVKTQVAGMIQH